MLRLSHQRGQAEAAQNVTIKSGNVVTRRNSRGKISRNLSSNPNAVVLVVTHVHELPPHLASQKLYVYLDHSERRTRLPHPRIGFLRLLGHLGFCRDGILSLVF